jgi:O-antigen/teichoic acid export membrane protein
MERLQISTYSIGQYNLAYTFGGYLEFFGSAIGMAIGPIYTSMFSGKSVQSAETIKFITNFLQVIFISISVIISLWCKELFELLIKNESLRNVYPIAIIIIMGYAYRPYYWTAITRLQYSEKTKELWKITFIAGVLNVILNIIFLPLFGIVSAAITTFVCLLYMGFSGYFLKSFREVESENYSPIFTIFTIITSTAIVYVLRDANWFFKLMLSLVLFGSLFAYINHIKLKLINLKLV